MSMNNPLAEMASSTKTAVENLTRRLKRIEVKENAPSALGLAYATFANLGTGKEGQVTKCTNCRKGAEGAGAGTGILVYWNVATNQWLRVYDNAVAAA